MKKLILILIASFGLLKSQTVFCPPGATWYCKNYGPIAGIDGYVKFSQTGTTSINNINCKVITGDFYGWRIGYSYLNSNTIIPNVKSYITYENNGVVYLYNGSGFDTVVNFNANIGDKWLELKHDYQGCLNNRTFYKVTDTGRVTINNVSLKQIKVTYTFVSSGMQAAATRTNYYTEKLMGQTSVNSMYADLFNFNCDFNGIPEYPFVGIICYEDNTFPKYNLSGSSCDNLTGIDVKHSGINDVRIYPNPSHDKLFVLSKDNIPLTHLRIYDISGRTVRESSLEQNNETEMDVSELAPGVYLVDVISNNRKATTKFTKGD